LAESPYLGRAAKPPGIAVTQQQIAFSLAAALGAVGGLVLGYLVENHGIWTLTQWIYLRGPSWLVWAAIGAFFVPVAGYMIGLLTERKR
jgi:hypothetical protein